MKRRLLALLFALLMIPRVHADGLPDLGDAGSADLSPLAERRFGEQIMRDIRWRDTAYLDDPEVEDYLNRLGSRLVGASPGAAQDFSFFAVRDGSLNAFALPGGYIGVHTGLVIAAQSESELASVLGHEIAHVTQRHIARLIGNQGRTGLVMLATLIVAVLAASRSPQAAEAAIATGQAVGLQAQLAYTRDFEREADRIGLQVLDAAGFDVRGMPSFFERLQRNSRLYENNAPAYLRTHPLTTERIADIANRTQGHRYRQVPDSLDFRLVRAKLAVEAAAPGDAVRQIEAIAPSGDALAQRYALVRAHLRAGQVAEARRAFERLEQLKPASPMIELLGAELLLAADRPRQAVERLSAALAAQPGRRALILALAEARLRAGEAARAVEGLRLALAERGDDYRLWSLLARAHAETGSRSGRHRAQAEAYFLQGALQAAVEQLELAQKAGDADFYLASAIDSRLRELRVRLLQEREAARNGERG